MGPSGSGKSTLLNLIGALDRPDSGVIAVDGKNLSEIKDNHTIASKADRIIRILDGKIVD